MADSKLWMAQGYSPASKRSLCEVPRSTNGLKTIHVTMINFLQLLVCPGVQQCSHRHSSTGAVVWASRSVRWLIICVPVPVTVMYVQSCTDTEGWWNQVWHILFHIGFVFMVKLITFFVLSLHILLHRF